MSDYNGKVSLLRIKEVVADKKWYLIPVLATVTISAFILLLQYRDSDAGKLSYRETLMLFIFLYLLSIVATLVGYLYAINIPQHLQQAILFVLLVYFTISVAKKFKHKKVLFWC